MENHHESLKASENVGGSKAVKRAPLGERKQNCVLGNSNSSNINVASKPIGQPQQQQPLQPQQQIPVKKRAERFEIFEVYTEEAEQQPSLSASKNQRGGSGGGNGSSDGDTKVAGQPPQQLQLLLFSPGKENVEPAPENNGGPELEKKAASAGGPSNASSSTPTYGHSFDSSVTGTDADEENAALAEEGDDGDGEELDESPSEYLTARSSSLVTFASARPGPPPESNTLYVTYDTDVYNWFLHREQCGRPKAGYMAKQSEINEDMRAVLLDWFVDVMAEFELTPATFFLAVSLTDRCLSVIDCPRERLQLLGATAILVATKMHEVFPPLLREICYVTEDSYKPEQVRRMEKVILKCVDFQLTVPLVDSFAEFFNLFSPFPLARTARHLLWYLLELSALDYQFVRFLPSRLAAAAFFLSAHHQQKLLELESYEENADCENGTSGCSSEVPTGGNCLASTSKTPSQVPIPSTAAASKVWSDEMVTRTSVKRRELCEPVAALIQLHKRAPLAKTQTVRRKFAAARRCHVSNVQLPDPEELASQFEEEAADEKKGIEAQIGTDREIGWRR